jgi:glucose-1-phosphate cytidylyltransferase
MKVVILAGGKGSRLSEETDLEPKPMVDIGGRPILWHIMKQYAHYGFNEFFIALGYKGEVIKGYFLDYYGRTGSITINLPNGEVEPLEKESENWLVHLIDTGHETLTGGRIKRLEEWLHDGTFMMTYGDSVSNIDLIDLLRFHRSRGRLATVTAVRPPARFGTMVIDGDLVAQIPEKSQVTEGWINGGFLVFEPGVFRYLAGDNASMEGEVLRHLIADGQLAAYKYDGFWHPMDTIRDVRLLQSLWETKKAPWKLWE